MKVSIVIVSYNSLKFLKECLDSILSQTFSDPVKYLAEGGMSAEDIEFNRVNYEGITTKIGNTRLC